MLLAWISVACRRHALAQQGVAEGEVGLVAGVGESSGTPDGALGTGQFQGPYGLAVHHDSSSGSSLIYVTEFDACKIRVIDAATGAISSVSGWPGLCGEVDGTASSARFNGPGHPALDHPYLYVPDRTGHTIRVVNVIDGNAVTLCGQPMSLGSEDGPAAAARFSSPNSLAFSASNGILYVADSGNHAIRAVAISDGSVTTLTGGIAGSPGMADGPPGTALPLVADGKRPRPRRGLSLRRGPGQCRRAAR